MLFGMDVGLFVLFLFSHVSAFHLNFLLGEKQQEFWGLHIWSW